MSALSLSTAERTDLLKSHEEVVYLTAYHMIKVPLSDTLTNHAKVDLCTGEYLYAKVCNFICNALNIIRLRVKLVILRGSRSI